MSLAVFVRLLPTPACLLLVMSAAEARPAQRAERGLPLVLRVRDSLTGRGVGGAELHVAATPQGAPARVLRIQGASTSLRLTPGERAAVRAPGYRPLALPAGLASTPEARKAAPAGGRSVTTIWLDAEDPPVEMSRASVAARLLPGAALLHGHVVDAATLEPMAGVKVRLEKAGVAASTDRRGYFWLTAPGARAAHSATELPETDDLLFEAAGYKLFRLANVALFETDTHFIVDMERGSGETGRDDAHKMLLGGVPASAESEARPGQEAASAGADPLLSVDALSSSARILDPPDSINVQGWGIVSLETYVGNGLNDEWIASWSQSSLRAGAVPYRSYGAWYQVNRGSICSTASCQVYDSDSSTSTVQAARATAGILLERGGAVARSEYSAENNCYRCGSYSCANTDLSCGSGFAGSPAASWSCLHDAHAMNAGPGQCCFGHGRGMCQWGTQAWAGTGSNWAWMVNHYYNDEGAGTGLRTMFMTSPLTVAAASASPASVAPGATFTVNLTGRSYAEHAHGQVLVRTRLVGASGTIPNGSGDPKVTLNARTDTALQVPFAVPATASAGTYDLVVELWLDADENGALGDPDPWLDTRTVPAAVTITGGTGCVATVPSDRWKGEYWSNKDLAGAPALVRDDGAGALGFDWAMGGPATCGVGTENFSARWTRTVGLAAGTYRFTVTSDDGFRLYVDGALKLDKWIIQGPTTYTVDVTLTAGNHALRMDYFENSGYAVAKLSWAPVADPCIATVPADRWRGEYWNNKDLSGTPAMVRDDGVAALAFDWGTGGLATCGLGNDNFSARWTRTASFAAGTYRFTATSDDGFRLYVDDALKLDKWILQGATTYTVDVALAAGNHTVRMDYFENGGYAVAKLSWALVANGCVATVPADRWKGEYWNNKDLSGPPAMVRDDGAAALAFDWGTGGPGACGVGTDNFAARWTRTASFAAGTHRFTVTSDDGFRFYVDDVLKLEKWILQAPTTYTVDVTLTAGSHALRMDYFENTGLAVAKLSWQGQSPAPPSFDAASSANAETANLTWTHSVAGSDRLLLVGTAVRGNVPVASVTYGGLPLTKIRHDTYGIDVRSELWYLVGPPVGTQNVSVQLSAAQSVVVGATSWTGVDQASPLASQAGATHGGNAGTTATVTLPSAADQVVVDVVATQAAGATLGVGPLSTQRWNRPGNYGNGAGSSQPGKATTSMSWTLAYPEFWTISAVAIKGSGASPSLEWPNAQSAANSDPWLAEHHGEIRRMRPRVLALNFVNHRSMDEMRGQLQQAIDAIAEGSRYHGYADAGAPPFLEYQLAYAVDLRDAQPPAGWPYRNSTLYPRENPVEEWTGFDYEQLFTPRFTALYNIPDPDDPSRRLGLCELIDRGLVHDVWVYGDGDVPDVAAAELLEMKPVYDENRQRVPGQMNRCAGNGCFDNEDVIPCTRTVRIAWFNNSRGPGCFLESMGHGVESMGGHPQGPIPYLRRYFIPFANFDLDTRYGRPFRNWYDVCPYVGPYKENCLGYPDETSVTYDNGTFAGSIAGYDPVCGNAHFPINARGQYDAANPATVRTSCANYRDGSGQTMAFTTDQFARYATVAPDCMGPWLVWWYQNFPGLDNASRDDAGTAMLNWWPFLFY